MTQTALSTIPESGVFLVKTIHSEYIVDMDRGLSWRKPVHPDANQALSVQETFTTIRCYVGQRMDMRDDFTGRWRNSTEVRSIEPYTEEVPE